MPNLAKFFVSLIAALFLLIWWSSPADAVTVSHTPAVVDENTPTVTVTISGLIPNKEYEACLQSDLCIRNPREFRATSNADGQITFTVCARDSSNLKVGCSPNDYFHAQHSYRIALYDGSSRVATGSFRVIHYYPTVTVTPQNPKPGGSITVAISGRRIGNDERNDYQVVVESTDNGGYKHEECRFVSPGSRSWGPLNGGSYIIKINENVNLCSDDFTYYKISFTVDTAGGTISPPLKDPDNRDNLPGALGRNPCVGGICPTALGNIPADPKRFAQRILQIASGLAGGIALILMVIGAIRVLTSSGDQQKLAGGRDMIVAAVSGLLFLIFSVLILRFIGINIVGI